MRTLIRNACIVDHDQGWPAERDILVEDAVIAALSDADPGQPLTAYDSIIDVAGSLVLPGFFNAHAHNHELYLKGTSWGLPLEQYMLQTSPRVPRRGGLSPDDVYQQTLAACGEMLLNGVTAVADDRIHPRLEVSDVEAVLHGYSDSGMRARVSIMVQDAPWRRSLPLEGEDPDYNPLLDDPPDDPEEALSLYERLAQRWSDPSSRVGLMVSPSAPQRCTPAFLHRLMDVARHHHLPFHIHVQETLAQYIAGPKLFAGRSMIRFLSDENLLGPEVTVAHAIWVTDDDVSAIADSGATVVHNPVSNLKLGSGAAPVRKLLDAGINVTLGTDGLTCNDALDMFEVTKTAALLSCIASPDNRTWLSPSEVLGMATHAAARANLIPNLGVIRPGQAADLLFLNSDSSAFVPRNNAMTQSVFSARSRDVQRVMIDGKWVVEDGRCLTVDLPDTHRRVNAAVERFRPEAQASLEENQLLMGPVTAAYSSAVEALEHGRLYRLVPDRRPVRKSSAD